MPFEELHKSRLGFDQLSDDDKAMLAGYQFNRYGIEKSTYGGGYWELFGLKYRKAIDFKMRDTLITPDIERYIKSLLSAKMTMEESTYEAMVDEEGMKHNTFFVPDDARLATASKQNATEEEDSDPEDSDDSFDDAYDRYLQSDAGLINEVFEGDADAYWTWRE